MQTKRRRQRKQQRKKGLFSKTNNFARAAHFFVYFFAVVLITRRQRETSRNFLGTRLVEEMLYVVLFTFLSLPEILPWWPLAVSHFLTAAVKFSCYSSNEIGLLCLFISGSSSFSVIHANVDFKIESKERISFDVVVFYL